MDIKCKKCECKYNKGCCCTAKEIKVGSGIDCETYEYCEEKAKDLKQQTAKNMFEVSSTLSPHEANKDAKIYCDANCLFNKNGLCSSNGITVLEGKNKTKTPCCVTQIN